MAYSGKFTPKNPFKYKGNSTNITYRSLWERRVMTYLDTNANVLEWSSEEIIVPYISPVDNRWHRYFPDFWVKVKNQDRPYLVEIQMIEIKPYKQTLPPEQKGRRTRKYITEVATYGINQAKWKAAEAYCRERNWKFVVLTEKEIGVN